MITQYEHDKLKENIKELEKTIQEKELILKSELEMNQFLKTHIESLKITVETVAQVNKTLTQKLAKERVLFYDKLNKLNE
jgi:anaerobic glycerol-3-phosphate dehydrogenase